MPFFTPLLLKLLSKNISVTWFAVSVLIDVYKRQQKHLINRRNIIYMKITQFIYWKFNLHCDQFFNTLKKGDIPHCTTFCMYIVNCKKRSIPLFIRVWAFFTTVESVLRGCWACVELLLDVSYASTSNLYPIPQIVLMHSPRLPKMCIRDRLYILFFIFYKSTLYWSPFIVIFNCML